ncbi:hypothetical protein LUZ60_011728 [Juncus effusus]|nr:hypothetical protein LUZ60_011728 [Juncus effusus]
MKTQNLDFILVPLGLLIMIVYHLWLLHRIIRKPTQTVIGINAINRRIWVQAIMQDPAKNGILAVQTLRNNIMASTLLASTAITLSSIIAALMNSTSSSKTFLRRQDLVLGNKSDLIISLKFLALLVCFLLAFFLILESVRYYSHATMLLSVPVMGQRAIGTDYISGVLNKGSYFWSLGLHAFYFTIPLFLWMFGPIPMFLCALSLVCLLYFLDVYSGYIVIGHGGNDGASRIELESESGSKGDVGSTERLNSHVILEID